MKTLVADNSISPTYLGGLLDEILEFISSIDTASLSQSIAILGDADISDVELVRNWEGCGFRLVRNNGGKLMLAIPQMVLDPENDANDLAGLITPTQARQIATNAQRINGVSATVNGHTAAIQALEYSLTATELEAAQAQQASDAAMSTADAAMSEAMLSTQEANKAKADAAKHRADVGIYPFRGIEAWQFGGNAGLAVGETYLREEDAFLTVTDTHPDWTPLDAQSTGSPTEAASDVVVYEQGRNLLLETNKHLNRSGVPQWICRTGAVGNSVDPVDHEQFCDTIGPKRYSQDLWPSLKPSYGDLTGFNRLSPNTDPATTWEVLLYPIRREVIRQGKTYTLQVTTYGAAIGLNAYIAKITGADPLCESTAATVETLANGARRHTFTFTATADGRPASASDKAQYYVYFHPTDLKGVWNSFEVWDLKLEEGDERSAWTPAPEDSCPNLLSEIKSGNAPYNQASHPKTDHIYRLGNALYHHEDGALVEMGGSNGLTGLDKEKLDALPANEALTATLNDKQGALQSSEDITVSDNKLSVTERAKRQAIIDIATRGGIVHNEETGLFAYNTLTDLTYTDVIDIISAGRLNADNCDSFYANNTKIRTNLTPVNCWNAHVLTHALWGCSSIEVFNSVKCALGYAAFLGCKKLHTIIGVLYNNGGNLGSCFGNCVKLQSMQLKLNNVATSFSLADSPLIDLASFQYMIANAANNSAITITVHPSVYAKLTGDTSSAVVAALTQEEAQQWQALVPAALAKNISFATI